MMQPKQQIFEEVWQINFFSNSSDRVVDEHFNKIKKQNTFA
jgi:DNA-binding response OmpR family regulator